MIKPPSPRDAANAASPELQQIFDSLLAVVLVLSKKATINYVNKAFEHITGIAPVEVIGISCLSVINEKDHEQTTAYFQALIQGKRIAHFQTRFRKKSGGFVITSWEGRWDERDEAFYIVFRDATERQQLAEINARHAKELKQKNEEMRETLERIQDGFFSLDRDWKFIYCNGQAENMIGRTQEQLLSKSYWECFPTMIGSMEETYYRKAATQQVPVHFEAFYPKPRARWFSIGAYPSATGISVYFREVTAQKTHEEQRNQYEKKLVQQNLHYQQILDRITDAFYAVDNDWTVTFINEKAEQMLNLTREEMLGSNLWAMLPKILGTSIEKNFREAISLQQPRYFIAPSTISKKLLEFSLYPSPNGLTVYYRDITEKEQKERELCKLSLLAKQTEDGVIFLNTSGGITWCNQAFIRMSGYGFEEAVGRTPDALLKGTDTDKTTLNQVKKRFRKGLPAHAEILNYNKDENRSGWR